METKVKIAAIRERRRRTGFAHPSPYTHSSLCEGGSINNELIYKNENETNEMFFRKIINDSAEETRGYNVRSICFQALQAHWELVLLST